MFIELKIDNKHYINLFLGFTRCISSGVVKSSLRDTDRAMTPPSESILALNNLYHEEGEKCQVFDE